MGRFAGAAGVFSLIPPPCATRSRSKRVRLRRNNHLTEGGGWLYGSGYRDVSEASPTGLFTRVTPPETPRSDEKRLENRYTLQGESALVQTSPNMVSAIASAAPR
jgi:hypothetical protein